jgi:hypothetical protein
VQVIINNPNKQEHNTIANVSSFSGAFQTTNKVTNKKRNIWKKNIFVKLYIILFFPFYDIFYVI